MRPVLLLIILSGCMTSVPQVKKIVKPEKAYNYCLRGKTFFRKKLEVIELCTETLPTCNKALSMAKTYGELAKLSSVDICTKRVIVRKPQNNTKLVSK